MQMNSMYEASSLKVNKKNKKTSYVANQNVQQEQDEFLS